MRFLGLSILALGLAQAPAHADTETNTPLTAAPPPIAIDELKSLEDHPVLIAEAILSVKQDTFRLPLEEGLSLTDDTARMLAMIGEDERLSETQRAGLSDALRQMHVLLVRSTTDEAGGSGLATDPTLGFAFQILRQDLDSAELVESFLSQNLFMDLSPETFVLAFAAAHQLVYGPFVPEALYDRFVRIRALRRELRETPARYAGPLRGDLVLELTLEDPDEVFYFYSIVWIVEGRGLITHTVRRVPPALAPEDRPNEPLALAPDLGVFDFWFERLNGIPKGTPVDNLSDRFGLGFIE